MAAKTIFETQDRLSQQTDYTSVLVEGRRDKLILLDYLARSGIKGTDSHKDWTRETEAKPAQVVGFSTIAEGQDWNKSTSIQTNNLIKSVMQLVQSKGWQITEEAEELNNGRLSTNSRADLIEEDAFSMLLGIERTLGSAQECVEHTGTGVVTKTRGLGSWLDPGTHTVLPFDATYAPAGELKGTTAITQADLEGMMTKAYQKALHRLHLTAFVGIGLKRTLAGFLNMVQTTAGYDTTLRRNVDADARGITNIVDFMEFDAGRVETVVAPCLFADTTTFAETAQSSDCGLFLELDRFGLEWVKRVKHYDMTGKLDLGGGARGFHRAGFRVNCQDASGSFRVLRTAE